MGKFNVGDRVKLIKVDFHGKSVGLKVGMVGTVMSVFSQNSCNIKFDNWHTGWGEDDTIWWVEGYMIEKETANE